MNRFEQMIAKFASKAERFVSSRFQSDRKPETIEPFIGYATPDRLVVLGRVMSHVSRSNVVYGQSRLRNVSQMLRRFMTSEVGGAQVAAGGQTAISDEEGYFQLHLPRDKRTGWVNIDVTLAANGEVISCPVLIPDKAADIVVISDIDDTVMETGAYSLTRNLWTSFTGNILTRRIFSDAAVLLDRLSAGGQRPVYYVSSSPWNLHSFLATIFERGSVVRGPMFLRDLGLSETKLITNGHGDHKGAAIDTILAANPNSKAILMGDTGQKDAHVYLAAVEKHPGRIHAVLLREPGPGPNQKSLKDIRRIEEAGVEVFHGSSFAAFKTCLLDGLDANSPEDQKHIQLVKGYGGSR